MNSQTISIEIEKYRAGSSDRQWELPAWGHPLSQGVLPLFITFEDRLFPVGTAFTIGRGVTFAVSAAHNIYEAIKREGHLQHRLLSNDLPPSVQLKESGISLLYQRVSGDQQSWCIWPFETVEGAPPSDLVIGYPQFQSQFPTLVNRLSFDIPPIGERVWSVGYTDMTPTDGIPLADVRSGKFDLRRDYSHRFVVQEGYVERIFTHRFASGFVGGSCFTFEGETAHGQSGGPVMYTDGVVCGVNSAVTDAFGAPRSIASLLYPVLFHHLRFGADIGPVRLNANHQLIDLVFQGTIPTDGSEERVAARYDEANRTFSVSPKVQTADVEFVHDDFPSFQAGRTATKQTEPVYRFRKPEPEKGV